MAKSGTHLHGCPTCGLTFVCGCRDYRSDPRCIPCIGGHEKTAIHFGRMPIACCRHLSRQARKDEIATYRLAGSQPWWICAECKRTFTYQPTEESA